MNQPYKVLLYEAMHEAGTRILEEKSTVVYANGFDEDSLVHQVGDVDAIIIRANGRITRRIVESAPRLRVIGRHGVGLDPIDLEAARECGVRIVYTPMANTQSVAEHFVGLALDLAKSIGLGNDALRRGHWQARYQLIGTEMGGKTLGVVGFGRIGQRTAAVCKKGFDMELIYYDTMEYPEAARELGAARVGIEELFARSDFISINLPLLPQTRHLIDYRLLSLMKPSAFLINMARGPVWKEEDVVRALREKLLAGVGSDVYEVEPAPADNPLFQFENFRGTPHMAAHSEEAMIKMSLVAQDVLAILEGKQPQFAVL